jgi:hypothetical protein
MHPSGKPASPRAKNIFSKNISPFSSKSVERSGAVFCMKPFIKTNQWPEYCGNPKASVKKKRREMAPLSFLNDQQKYRLYPDFFT